jgi:uncharacterized membrane protein YsdA (DUF1294 family)/cold shock CspA family protein
MRCQGRVTAWKDERGFGFISPDDGGQPVFAHISSFTNRGRRPAGGELVTYEFATDDQGRLQAKAVAFVGDRARRLSTSAMLGFPSLLALCFIVLLGSAVFSGWLPPPILFAYLVASVITFFAYAFDKSAAVRRQWRTAESTLHLFAMIGGWPGAVFAQQFLRHKSSKWSFQVYFWSTVILNCMALAWLMSPPGVKLLRTLLSAS